jgi:SAM-dependent methyltransferase
MQKHFTRLIPDFLKPTLKKIYYLPSDTLERLRGRDSMIPPKSMIHIGAGDFIKIGEEFKHHFINLGGLQPDDKVLDIGCGIGRMAIPLTGYLTQEGEYWGFDIVAEWIDWCQNRISPKFSNFHFLHSDVYNQHYNKNGQVLAQDFQFPFNDQSFDFVFLTSVFTHMLPLDLENYLSEIARVLKPGGKCLITFFILNEETEALIRAGRSALDFRYQLNGCLTIDEDDPEAAIAYSEAFLKELFTNHGLKIIPPIHYGSWCGREAFLTYQDIIVGEKS